jgi:hypothetical protein
MDVDEKVTAGGGGCTMWDHKDGGVLQSVSM